MAGKGLTGEMAVVTRPSNTVFSNLQVLNPDSKSHGEADSTIQQTFVKTAAKLRENYTLIHTITGEEVMTKVGQMEVVVRFRPKHEQNKVEDIADDFKVKLTPFFVDNIMFYNNTGASYGCPRQCYQSHDE